MSGGTDAKHYPAPAVGHFKIDYALASHAIGFIIGERGFISWLFGRGVLEPINKLFPVDPKVTGRILARWCSCRYEPDDLGLGRA